MFDFLKHEFVVKEIPKGMKWFNSDGVGFGDYDGIFLMFFWSFADKNSLVALDIVKRLYERYSDVGLTVVGVHSPGFSFERDSDLVERYLVEEGVEFPVVHDEDLVVWNEHENHWRPRCLVFTEEAGVIADVVGIDRLMDLENVILGELRRLGVRGLPADVVGAVECVGEGVTPDVFLSVSNGVFANRRRIECGHIFEFEDGGVISGVPLLKGKWLIGDGFVRSLGGTLVVPFFAQSVYLVAGFESVGAGGVFVCLDGEGISHVDAGSNVSFLGGAGVVSVGAGGLYEIVNSQDASDRELSLVVDEGVSLFAMNFR